MYDNLTTQAEAYFSILAQIEELQAQAEAIKDGMKAVMVERATEEIEGPGWRATWHNVSTSRFDSRRFKADHADLYAAYSVNGTGTRFTLNPIGQ